MKGGQWGQLASLLAGIEEIAERRLDQGRECLAATSGLFAQARHHLVVDHQSSLHMENHTAGKDRRQQPLEA